ncbi:uncharacterized protein TRAVEDRAFT_74351 [Trametes versicolor FP-101664 SS1]|uniref:uncharacterized protein n=1 Tax=Trametes versicolor (strain FP-101664) TaxID=717944 RepID=UPI000462327E|nr:uncharacterized protein TRAVEDRAFT_74351 [Trametes versicolor FP-101664 SS1]EIW54071.1 hypothetical protein TRAVEDRAFT_74351 [Trametes versicolor FP-101664 SS1]
MSTISTLTQGSASAPQSGDAVPSTPSARTPPSRSRTINVVIPSAQVTALATPIRALTFIHGHGLIATSSDEVLNTETFTHGHGDFAVVSPHGSPATPTQSRAPTRTRRRSSLFSASNTEDEEAGVGASPHSTGAGAGGLTMAPMGESEEHEAPGGDEQAASQEN